MTVEIRHNWSLSEIEALLSLPLVDLLWQAQQVHREANPGYRVQLASLLSVRRRLCLLPSIDAQQQRREWPAGARAAGGSCS